MKPIGAADVAKHYGLKNLGEVSKISGVPYSTLICWFKTKRHLFEVVVLGCVQQKIMGAKAYAFKTIEE